MNLKFSLITLTLIISGCSAVTNEAVFEGVQGNVEQHLGAKVFRFSSKQIEDEAIGKVKEILQQELTPDSAVQVALLNNRALQATFEELGIARADVLEATLLPNPLLSVSERFPSGGGTTNLEFGITENFLSFLYLPLKRSIAESALEAAKAKISNEVLSVAFEVRGSFYELQAALQDKELLSTALQASEASFITSKKIHDAGNNTDLELQNDRVLYEQTKLDLARSETMLRQLREKLNALLGLWGKETSWTINERLPEIPKEEVDLSDIENRAISNRLDLLSAKANIETTAKALGIAVPLSVFSESGIGVDSERDPSGSWVAGPNIALPIPFLNQGQAATARAQAQYNSAVFRYHDLAVRIRSEAKTARDNLVSLRHQIEFIKNVLIPLRHSIVSETQTRYNGMLLGVFTLLMAKQGEIEAGRQYIAALKDYWKAHSELERALGCALSAQVSVPQAMPMNSTNPKHIH